MVTVLVLAILAADELPPVVPQTLVAVLFTALAAALWRLVFFYGREIGALRRQHDWCHARLYGAFEILSAAGHHIPKAWFLSEPPKDWRQ